MTFPAEPLAAGLPQCYKLIMTTTRRPARNRHNGQYTFDGSFDRLCKCGRRFGEHMAGAPHDLDDEQTSCPGFRPAKAVA